MKHYHYTYRIDFINCDKVYFGVRSSKCLPEDDFRYIGSPITHKKYWSLYTPKKTILNTYNSREEAEIAEDALIIEQWAKDKTLSLNAGIRGSKFNNYGKTISQKNREAIRKANTGRKGSQKQRDAVRESNKNRQITQEYREACRASKVKPYYLISPTGDVFEGVNIRLFCRANGLSEYNINSVISGNNFHCNGWTTRLELHKLFIEYYRVRGINLTSNKRCWFVQWVEQGKRKKEKFSSKSAAIAYRDNLSLQGVTWRVCPKDWKTRLAAMQVESA